MRAFRSQSLIGIGDDRMLLEPGNELFPYDDLRFFSWLRNLNNPQFTNLIAAMEQEEQLPTLLHSLIYQICYATKYKLLGEDNRQHYQTLLGKIPEILAKFEIKQRNALILDSIFYNHDTDIPSLPKEEILPFPFNFNLVQCLIFVRDINLFTKAIFLLSPDKLISAYECIQPEKFPINWVAKDKESNKDLDSAAKIIISSAGQYLQISTNNTLNVTLSKVVAETTLSKHYAPSNDNLSSNIDYNQLLANTCRQQSWVSQINREYSNSLAIA